jgi:transaldolase
MQELESKLHLMTRTTPTTLWNDSCSLKELSASIENNGAVGATCNPVIVLNVVKKEMETFREAIRRLLQEMPTESERDIAWRLVEEMSVAAASLLRPRFDAGQGREGRLSIQTDPAFFRNPAAILAQALHFHSLAPNMIVKVPATKAGIIAMEEATWRGVSINATVSFSVAQAIAVAEAVERGLARRRRDGLDVAHMGPVTTIMVGRLDDWLRVVAEKDNVIANPEVFDWAGVAVMKKAYAIYRERGYNVRLLSAAFRNHRHWSEFIGGDLIISPPFEWQVRYNNSDVEVRSRIAESVDDAVVQELARKFADFRMAWDEKGMCAEQFDSYGPTRRTVRQFSEAVDGLVAIVRDVLIPNPA